MEIFLLTEFLPILLLELPLDPSYFKPVKRVFVVKLVVSAGTNPFLSERFISMLLLLSMSPSKASRAISACFDVR